MKRQFSDDQLKALANVFNIDTGDAFKPLTDKEVADKAREIHGGADFYEHFEALQGDELTRAVIDDVIATHEAADSYKYMLLDRLRTDCGYYLDGGNRNCKYLWGGSVRAHLGAMRALYDSFPEDDRPEWLTAEQIDD